MQILLGNNLITLPDAFFAYVFVGLFAILLVGLLVSKLKVVNTADVNVSDWRRMIIFTSLLSSMAYATIWTFLLRILVIPIMVR